MERLFEKCNIKVVSGVYNITHTSYYYYIPTFFERLMKIYILQIYIITVNVSIMIKIIL